PLSQRPRCPAASNLTPPPTPPTRPWRQPPTQLRASPHRDHPGTRPPRSPRLHRSQEKRRQKQPRSDPLPQTTTRPHRLQHAESEHHLDIGATLAHAMSHSLGSVPGTFVVSCLCASCLYRYVLRRCDSHDCRRRWSQRDG